MNTRSRIFKNKQRMFRYLWLTGWLVLSAFFLWKGIRPDATNANQVKSNPATFKKASRLAKPIEQIQVGDRVTTQLSERARVEAVRELGGLPWWDGQEVDPQTWCRIQLATTNHLGYPSDVVLLRPLRWIEEHGATAGATIEISMPEQGVEGPARVISIDACPEIQEGGGRVVTGTFCHRRGNILQLHLAGTDEPIGVTDNHPIWSVDRQKFIPSAELRLGERLRPLGGLAEISQIQHLPDEQHVYNLEVHGDHVYHVSTLGVLVHNTTPGRTGKQSRLRELSDDPNVSSADRGWIKQEMNQIARGKRKNIRLPGSSKKRMVNGREYGGNSGKVLAHRRGNEARSGFGYKHSDLQDVDLHKLQHKHEGYK